MDDNSSVIVTKNNNSISNSIIESNNLEDIFSVFDKARSINDNELNNYINEHISTQNYYIFFYFLAKFKTENFIPKIKSFLSDKLNSQILDLSQLNEDMFEGKYMLFVDLNSLSQAIDINFDKFVKYYLNKEKKVPNPIIPKLLEKEWVDVIKIMLDLKVNVHEIESVNAFTIGKSSFIDLYFQPLNKVDENVKIIKKSVLLPKHIVYYLYKSTTIGKITRENLIKYRYFKLRKLAGLIDFDGEQILLFILKMKDQDLVEELISNDIVSISSKNIVISLVYSLKFNCARIAYLIFQMMKREYEHLSNLTLHRSLIRGIIDYPENIEIFIYIAKNLVPYINTSNLKYLLSTLEQLLYFKEIEDCKFLRVLNVLKTSVLIIELIKDIRSAAHQLIIFCDNLRNQYMTLAKTLIMETSDKNTLINLFTDKDLLDRETILIISNNQFVELLDNPATAELVNKLWVGQVSTQGKFYTSSTQYDIVNCCENSYQLISSLKNVTKRNPQNFNFYFESFFIWNNSILVKFYSKTFFFVMIALLFQLSFNLLFIRLKNVFLNMALINEYQPFIKNACYKIEGKNYTANQIINLSLNRGNLTDYYNQFYQISNNSNSSQNQKLPNATLNLIPSLIQNISIITNLYTIAKSELTDDIKAYSKFITYFSYILIYPFFDIIFKKLYIYKSGIFFNILNVQFFLDTLILIIIILRICDSDINFLDSFNKLDSIENFTENDYVRFSYYLAAMLILLWVKVVEDLKFSEKLGPLIRIVEQIVIQVFNFGVILTTEVFVIGSLANLLFALDNINFEYRSLQNSILLMFSAIINQFSYHFDEFNAVSGSIFLTFHLFISYVILLNMLIAVLSKIYEGLYENSKMLFQQEIITRKNQYLVDNYYGGLINLPFPLNILNIFFWPFYMSIENKQKLKKFNKLVNSIAYFPLLLGMSIAQISTQLIFIPLTISKILKIFVGEILYSGFSSIHKLSQIKTLQINNNSNKFRNILICLILILLFPLWILYIIVFDFVFYIRSLFKESENLISLSANIDDICVSPLILSKIGEVFDTKPKNADLLMENVIEEFVDQLSYYNPKFDFKNFLIIPPKIPKENLSLIKEYSNFVKFANKLKLYNSFQKHVIIKSLVIKLIESNSNYVQIKKKVVTNTLLNNQNREDPLDVNNKSEHNSIDLVSEKYLNSIFDEKERGSIKYYNIKKALTKFTSLPTLFYKRISMINLQDVYNAMNIIKSSENLERSSLKLRSDLKKIRKNVGEIVDVLNAKEILLNQKKNSNVTLFKQRKASIFVNSNFANNNSSPIDNISKSSPIKSKLTRKLSKNLDKMQNIPEEKDD